MKYEIKSAYAASIGESHLLQGGVCQDRIGINDNGCVRAIVLCDGAGSFENSHLVASAVVNILSEYLVNHFEKLYMKKKEGDESYIKSELLMYLSEQMSKKEFSMQQVNCTMLAVAISEEGRWLAFHVGDGIIFSIEESVHVISKPENGKNMHETYFVSDPKVEQHLRVYGGVANETLRFLLSSDGCYEALYDVQLNHPANAVSKMSKWLDEYTENEVTEAIQRELNETFGHYSADDLSIGIILCQRKGE